MQGNWNLERLGDLPQNVIFFFFLAREKTDFYSGMYMGGSQKNVTKRGC